VFQAIAQASARGQELLGSTPEASAQVRPLARPAAQLPAAPTAWSERRGAAPVPARAAERPPGAPRRWWSGSHGPTRSSAR
jgi:hypothetical protein